MRVGRFKFEAIPWDTRWFPIGKAANGDDVFVDGCVIDDKQLAERIAMNMEAAYNQGVEDAARDFIQHAVATCEKAGMQPARSACGAGWIIDEPEETCHAAQPTGDPGAIAGDAEDADEDDEEGDDDP